MSAHIYIVLPPEFEEHNGYIVPPNMFNAVWTKDGRLVCSYNSLNEFPELFEGMEIETVDLVQDDFPVADEEIA